ncbi:galactose-1-phosphate uridylyltransferase [Intrasporangium sp. DVR]|uniref:galactose-1-phosphate uridylyltransferase n=1 Tax=Intrasporangium sp. DVR TaxID=3127867 RepID=UPI003340FF8E
MERGIGLAHEVRRTSARLADGREIIYFDDVTEVRSPRPDERPLGTRAEAGEMRFDALTGEWVAVASHRQNRTFLPPPDECPLCPTGRGSVPSEVPEPDYDVVVFENRFPSFSEGAPDIAATVPEPLFATAPARGRCEVVCFTSEHTGQFAQLPPARVATVLDAWVDRTTALSSLPGVEYVFCFENRGPEIGVTLHHPHGQIYAYPYVPARSRAMLERARAHRQATGRLLGSDLLAAERAAGSRVVLETDHWTAYAPFASRWPVEVHLVPNRSVPDLPSLIDDERADLSRVYPQLLRRLDRFHAAPTPIPLPYIAGWHQAPVHEGRDDWRLSMQITSILRAPGKLKYLAGSESGVGGWVTDVTPESVAARLRELGDA